MILFSSKIFVVLLLRLRHLLVTLLTAIVFKGINAHTGHARDFAWYRGQRPSPARMNKM